MRHCVFIAFLMVVVGGCGLSPEDGGGGSGGKGGAGGSGGKTRRCGNRTVEVGEDCDSVELNQESCESLGYASGRLACAADCRFDTQACIVHETCGDGTLDAHELCEGLDLRGRTCQSEGHGENGQLECTRDCTHDWSDCSTCGNTVREGAELCDGTDFGAKTCRSEVGQSYRGELLCTSGCAAIETSACSLCGNSILDVGEECDGGNMNGANCASLGGSGSLRCTAGCRIDYTDCEGMGGWCVPDCVDDSDCFVGRCNAGICDGSCTAEHQCSAVGWRCNNARGLCVLCLSNADCPATRSRCFDGICGCGGDDECAGFGLQRCDVTTGLCALCVSDLDCPFDALPKCFQVVSGGSYCGCADNADCSAGARVCQPHGICGCREASDCPLSSTCLQVPR